MPLDLKRTGGTRLQLMRNESLSNPPLSIGAVAKRAGLRVSALRYYESVGLIAPARRVAGRRVYDETVFSSIALVQLAQDAGFTVAEMRKLLSGFDPSTPASARWQTMARRKLTDVERRIEQAERMKQLLEKLLQCRCESLEQCVRFRSEALRSVAILDDPKASELEPSRTRGSRSRHAQIPLATAIDPGSTNI